MFEYFGALFDSKMLSPHGFCLLWRPELLWTHVISDALIGIAYMTIPVSIAVILRRRMDVPFGLVPWLFVAFISACGLTHFTAIWTLWNPDYGPEAILKAATAVVSVFTAVMLWKLVPLAVSLPSPAHLQLANAKLEAMVAERDLALTQLREESAQREKAEEALRQSQKIEAIGQLTGGVAHDFNNLLTVIIGGLDTIRKHPDGDPARLKRAADMAFQGAQRAAGLTTRLLAFARRQPLTPTRLEINRVVTGLTDLLHRTLGEQIELEAVLSPRLWTVEVDQHQLESALVNLAVNARDAMAGGGKLTIETANVELGEHYVEVDSEVIPGQYVMVAVSDSGSGMSPETVGRVFEPFFTTKEVGQGTGLGLSMVYGFVKQSNGHVTIYSEEDIGTTAKLYFPRVYEAAEEVGLIAESVIPQGESSETILVVEDNHEVRAFSVENLLELGYSVVEAADGEAALAILRSDVPVSLLFTDVVMPGMSGKALSDQARILRPDLPTLFTTGYSRNAIIHNGRLDPGVSLLGKPFTVEQLAVRVREILDRLR